MKYLDAKTAYKILMEESQKNPGNWVKHSENVGKATKIIAEKIGLNADKAGAMGYVHDIGRIFGTMKERHSIMGYLYLKELGYDEAARICVTHIFMKRDITASINSWDGTEDEYQKAKEVLEANEYDEYDKLIQLTDSIALHKGILPIERRLVDCALRYRPEKAQVMYNHWEIILRIQDDVEQKLGHSIYKLFPEIEEEIYRPIREALSYNLIGENNG